MFSALIPAGCHTRAGAAKSTRTLAAAMFVVSLDTFAVGLGGGVPLYDAGSNLFPSHADWGWSYASTDSSVVPNVASGVLMLNTPVGAQSGYALYQGANLNSTLGFKLDFTLRVAAENHDANANRSGFSIIVLDQQAQGVELSFWTDKVWAKSEVGFTFAESIDVNTQVEQTYRLTVQGGHYTLATDGAATLAGGLRHYTYTSGNPIADGIVNSTVYDQTHFIFFGDNTTSAGASLELRAITLAPVPEPAEWALMLAGLGCVAAALRRRRS